MGNIQGFIFENTKAYPSTPYGISHLATDLTLLAYYKYNKFPFVISRFSNFYGPHQQLYRLIPKALYCIFNNKKLLLHGGGKSVRSFIYIDDFCEGIYKSMINGKPGEIYNFTSREYVSIKWLVKKICLLTSMNFNKLVKITKDRPTKDNVYKMDPTKAERELNWKAKYTIKEGLEKTIKWYKKNKKMFSVLLEILDGNAMYNEKLRRLRRQRVSETFLVRGVYFFCPSIKVLFLLARLREEHLNFHENQKLLESEQYS